MLRARFISAVLLVPLVALAVYVGGLGWLVGVVLAGMLGWREMVHLLESAEFTLDRNLGLFFVIGALLEAYAYSAGLIPMSFLRPLLAGLIIFSLIWALYYKGEHATANWGITVASALYLGFLLSHFISLRERTDGFLWVLIALALTWICDSAAYFVGSLLGKHKLWPRLSPKKTWEGLFGGILVSMLAGPLLTGWLLGLPLWQGLVLGALVATFDPFGDFAISLFKRYARIKDSGQLIPGHGGVLDRLDSLLFVFPVVTYFALVVAGP